MTDKPDIPPLLDGIRRAAGMSPEEFERRTADVLNKMFATEQRPTTTMVADPSADLFREAKDQIALLEYLAKQHKALDEKFPAHFSRQAADVVQQLRQFCRKVSALFPYERANIFRER